MITWEHLRFLALLIPTWLVLGAVAVSVALPSKGRADSVQVVQAAPAAGCRDAVAVAAPSPAGEE